jgi:hypothetical protein
MIRPLAALPNKFSQGVRVGLRPDSPATEASIALLAKVGATFVSEGKEVEVVWFEDNEACLRTPVNGSFSDVLSATF